MKRSFVAALLVAALGASPSAARAQLPISFELHGGFGVPSADLGDVAETGYSLGLEALFQFADYLAAYGGFSLSNFPCDDSSPDIACSANSDFESSGLGVGARGSYPLTPALRPWASLGAIFHDIQLVPSKADGDTGLELGVGVELALSDLVMVGPQFRYRSYSVTETVDPDTGATQTTDVGFYSVELTLRFRFGS